MAHWLTAHFFASAGIRSMSRYMDRIPAPQTSMMASEHMFTLFCICQDSIHVQVHGSNPSPLDLNDTDFQIFTITSLKIFIITLYTSKWPMVAAAWSEVLLLWWKYLLFRTILRFSTKSLQMFRVPVCASTNRIESSPVKAILFV